MKKENSWCIMGKLLSNGETEEIDSGFSYLESKKMLKEYRLSFGMGWKLWIKNNNN
jgi:hypothetical protein